MSDKRLVDWICETDPNNLFRVCNEKRVVLITRPLLVRRLSKPFKKCVLFIVSDFEGKYCIPTLVNIDFMKKIFPEPTHGSTTDKIYMDEIKGCYIRINKSMVAAYRRNNDTAAPYLILLDWELIHRKTAKVEEGIQDVCDNESVRQWANIIKNEIDIKLKPISKYFYLAPDSLLLKTFPNFNEVEEQLEAKIWKAQSLWIKKHRVRSPADIFAKQSRDVRKAAAIKNQSSKNATTQSTTGATAVFRKPTKTTKLTESIKRKVWEGEEDIVVGIEENSSSCGSLGEEIEQTEISKKRKQVSEVPQGKKKPHLGIPSIQSGESRNVVAGLRKPIAADQPFQVSNKSVNANQSSKTSFVNQSVASCSKQTNVIQSEEAASKRRKISDEQPNGTSLPNPSSVVLPNDPQLKPRKVAVMGDFFECDLPSQSGDTSDEAEEDEIATTQVTTYQREDYSQVIARERHQSPVYRPTSPPVTTAMVRTTPTAEASMNQSRAMMSHFAQQVTDTNLSAYDRRHALSRLRCRAMVYHYPFVV